MKYLIIAILFVACNNLSLNRATPAVSTEVLDTIQTMPIKAGPGPLLFETAFSKGTTQPIKNATVALYGVSIGKLKLSSGRLVACDPMHIDEYGKPFTQVFPTGEFPVQLSIARFNDGESIAFARILFSKNPVVRWEPALLEGQSPMAIGDEKMHGYSVDAAVGVFLDVESIKALDLAAVDNMDGAVYTEMDRHYHNSWRYAMYAFGNHNLAAFTSGFGDGNYATYTGFDANGKPCRLVTDFEIFDWRRNDTGKETAQAQRLKWSNGADDRSNCQQDCFLSNRQKLQSPGFLIPGLFVN